MVGRTEPRLWTPPLRDLTPDTSRGFDWVEFARDVVRRPFDPWQEWAAVHAGELLPDGRPRFRVVLLLVARQNGKTELPVILSTYWQFVDAYPLILGTSTKLEYAKESWRKAIQLVERTGELADRHPKRWTRETNGEQESWTHPDPVTLERSRHKIAASNAEGGRSLTINRLICDELRQHYSYAAWNACEPATNAVWDAQIWCLSNAGDARSVVLNDIRRDALDFVKWWEDHGSPEVTQALLAGEDIPEMSGDWRTGLFEWSAPPGADPEDIDALAQANPNLGRRKDPTVLLRKARAAKRVGGEALTGFLTEDMCVTVPRTDPAIDLSAYRRCEDPGTLSDARSRVALFIDVAPDLMHATLCAAAQLPDGRVRGEVVAAWAGPRCVDEMRRDLPVIMARVRPRALGWLPGGPAAALGADMASKPGWPPRGVRVEALRADAPAVCMGFAEQVVAGRYAHSMDPLMQAQVESAERQHLPGRRWVFARPLPSGGAGGTQGHVDAVYAMAGAVHLARSLPPPPAYRGLIVVSDP